MGQHIIFIASGFPTLPSTPITNFPDHNAVYLQCYCHRGQLVIALEGSVRND